MTKSESGTTAVEFSLVAFPFFMLLGCICETGIMLFSEYAIQVGVQEAAREIRTGQAQDAGLSAAAFKSKICELAGIVIDCECNLTVYAKSATTFAVLKTLLPSYLNVGAKPDGTPNPTLSIVAWPRKQPELSLPMIGSLPCHSCVSWEILMVVRSVAYTAWQHSKMSRSPRLPHVHWDEMNYERHVQKFSSQNQRHCCN